jgi:hypothetical protein
MSGELEATLKVSPFLESVAVVGDPLFQAPGDDPDGDGTDNLAEHASGTNPAVIDRVETARVEPGLVMILRLPDPPPDDVRYEVMQTLDYPAGIWTVLAGRDGAGPWTGLAPSSIVPAGPGFIDIAFGVSTYPRAFYRLRLTLIEP